MKTNSISKRFTSVLLIVSLFALFSTPLMAADSYFEKGKTYNVRFMFGEGDVLVLSKSDNFGWIKVKVLSGDIKHNLPEGLVNITTALYAKEIK